MWTSLAAVLAIGAVLSLGLAEPSRGAVRRI
jgi:hypothetical protein